MNTLKPNCLTNNTNLIALSNHLNLEIESPKTMADVNCRFSTVIDGAHCISSFVYDDTSYYVCDKNISFHNAIEVDVNDKTHYIKKMCPNSPYQVFNDDVIIERLKPLTSYLGNDYQIVAINQVEHLALLRNNLGLLVVFSYTAHFPEVPRSYHYKGSTSHGMRDVVSLFDGLYVVQPNDKMAIDQK